MTIVFSGRNYFRLFTAGSEGFKTDTVYRFLSNPNYNWRMLLLTVSRIIMRDLLKPLTSADRVKCYILDSSIYQRTRSKKVELLSWVYDHNLGLSVRGFQKLLLAWTDGFSTIPIQHALLSSRKESKRICGLRNKKMDARYVLMDSWFTFPSTISKIRTLHIHVIGMIKKTSEVHYLLEGQALDVKQIFRKLRKRWGRAKILASTRITMPSLLTQPSFCCDIASWNLRGEITPMAEVMGNFFMPAMRKFEISHFSNP